MKNKSKKKLILILAGLALVVVLAGAGIVYASKNSNKATVPVIPISMLNNAEWFDTDSSLSGTVTSQYIQEVYLSGSSAVDAVYVKEGDVVKEGDKLLKYNVEEEELDLKLQDLQMQSSEIEIEEMKKDLEKLKKTKPVSNSTNAKSKSVFSLNAYAASAEETEGGEETDTPESASTSTEAPSTEAPSTQAPSTEAPTTEAPSTEAPSTEAPSTQEATTEVISTETLSTEEATTEVPSTEIPSTEAPSTEAPTTESDSPLKKDVLYKTITKTSQRSILSGNGSSADKQYIYLLKQMKESIGEGQSAVDHGRISGAVLNDLIKNKKYFTIREYISQESYINGSDPSLEITITPDTQFTESFVDKQDYTISYLQDILIKVSLLEIQSKTNTVYRGYSYSFPVKAKGVNIRSVKLDWSVSGNKSKSTLVSGGYLVVSNSETASKITITVSACGIKDSVTLNVKKPSNSSKTDYDDDYYGDYGNDNNHGYNNDDEPDYYTKEELERAIEEKEQEISEAERSLAEAKINYNDAKAQVEAATIKATVSGTVSVAHSIEDIPTDGSPIVVVKAEDGMYVKAEISELLLETIKVDGVLTCTSWETNETYEAVIKEISDYPSSENGGNTYGSNPNSSYYPIMAYIENAEGLSNGDSVSITYNSQSMGTRPENAIYLQKAYIRSESGQSYVYKQGENGKLIKQYIKTGGTVYGQYIEVLSGVSLEDYIAFPYGKTVKEGAKTEISEDDSNIIY